MFRIFSIITKHYARWFFEKEDVDVEEADAVVAMGTVEELFKSDA